jgi:hypothetical protein
MSLLTLRNGFDIILVVVTGNVLLDADTSVQRRAEDISLSRDEKGSDMSAEHQTNLVEEKNDYCIGEKLVCTYISPQEKTILL